jgi:hypothetical protein
MRPICYAYDAGTDQKTLCLHQAYVQMHQVHNAVRSQKTQADQKHPFELAQVMSVIVETKFTEARSPPKKQYCLKPKA